MITEMASTVSGYVLLRCAVMIVTRVGQLSRWSDSRNNYCFINRRLYILCL